MTAQDGATRWELLPCTILDKLLDHLLENGDVKAFRLVCRSWREAVAEHLSTLRPRSFRNEGQPIGSCFPELHTVDASQLDVQGLCTQWPTTSAFSQLTSLTRLSCLLLDNHEYLPPSGLQSLSSVTSLRRLYVRRVQFTPEGFGALEALTQLHVLDLSHCTCRSSVSCCFVSKMVNLRELCMQGCELNLRNSTVRCITRLTSLARLDMGWCLQDEVVQHVVALPSINHLTLGLAHPTLSMPSLERIAQWSGQDGSRVVHLHVRGDYHCSSRCMEMLSFIPGLRFIKFHHGMYDSNAVGQALPRLSSLHSLDLFDCYLPLYDTDLYRLASLSHLHTLHLRLGTGFVTPRGLASLGQLTNLCTLQIIGFEAVTDDVIAHWTTCLTRLQNLSIGDEESRWRPGKLSVSDGVFQSLTKLSGLTSLRVCGMSEGVLSRGLWMTLHGLRLLQDLTLQGLSPALNGSELAAAVHLTRLDVSFNSFDDHSLLQGLAPLHNLRQLVLGECHHLSPGGVLNAVQHLDRLRHLDVIGSSRLDYSGLKAVMDQTGVRLPKSLKVLMIPGCGLDTSWRSQWET